MPLRLNLSQQTSRQDLHNSHVGSCRMHLRQNIGHSYRSEFCMFWQHKRFKITKILYRGMSLVDADSFFVVWKKNHVLTHTQPMEVFIPVHVYRADVCFQKRSCAQSQKFQPLNKIHEGNHNLPKRKKMLYNTNLFSAEKRKKNRKEKKKKKRKKYI